MQPTEGDFNVDTLLSHFAEDEKIKGAVTPPLFQNSLFLFDKVEDLLANLTGNPEGPPYTYSRLGNPTVEIVEKKLAALEGVDACKVTGGGIGAASVALSSELEAGAHVVIVDTAYGPTRDYLNFLGRFGVSSTLVDGHCLDEIGDAIRPETKVIYLESPSSLLFRLQDVPAITKIAKEKGITTMLDNTYCSPLYMQPAKFGVDVVIHSGSKYLGGHSDINAGAICTDRARMDKIVRNELNYYSAMLHPFSAWLMLRGMRTLRLRVEQHERTANTLASWLESRPEVERVHHISLPSFPQRALYEKLMKGSTGLFSFEPKVQSQAPIYAFANALKLFGRGISWGGFESLVVPMEVPVHAKGDKRWLIRLFCGLEGVEDLQKDVAQALVHLQPK